MKEEEGVGLSVFGVAEMEEFEEVDRQEREGNIYSSECRVPKNTCGGFILIFGKTNTIM